MAGSSTYTAVAGVLDRPIRKSCAVLEDVDYTADVASIELCLFIATQLPGLVLLQQLITQISITAPATMCRSVISGIM